MNLILKDIDLIFSCTHVAYRMFLKKAQCRLWISELSMIGLSPAEEYNINSLITNNELNSYSFSDKEIEDITKVFNEYVGNISVVDAAAIVIAKRLDNSIILSKNGIYTKICTTLNVKNYDFNWFYDYIVENK